MRINNISVMNFENAIRGMRNPMKSWGKSDSSFGMFLTDSNYLRDTINECSTTNKEYLWDNCVLRNTRINSTEDIIEVAILGENDLTLAKKLISSGTEHRKFLRQIFVSLDISATLNFWKQMDTYSVGTTMNSTSTMYLLHKKEITIKDFLVEESYKEELIKIIDILEFYRKKYIETNDKKYLDYTYNLLPQSYLQLRTWTGNYEVLRNIYSQRKNHKLEEWKIFCNRIERLPYADIFITS